MQAKQTIFDGDTFEHKGRRFIAKYERDEFMGEPWKEHDGHGIVSEWTSRPKAPGERVLNEDRTSKRYYNVRETLAIARRDGWGVEGGRLPGESERAYAARAVEADFRFLRAWCRDEWEWIGVTVRLADDPSITESLSGIESCSGAYLDEVARELADEILSRVEVANPDVVLSEN